jgi:hypothetical protein
MSTIVDTSLISKSISAENYSENVLDTIEHLKDKFQFVEQSESTPTDLQKSVGVNYLFTAE